MDERKTWLEQRKKFVTASDVAAMLGESPYKTRAQLLMEKAGLADTWAGNEHTDTATLLEGASLDIARHRYGWDVRPWGLTLVQDPECPELAATPDALMCTPYGNTLVQVKWTRSSAMEDCKPLTQKGKPSTAGYLNGPPIYYQIQCQAEMSCMGLQHSVLLVMHHGQGLKLRPYYIPRHDGVIARMRREAVQFWSEVNTLKAGERV